MFRDDCNADLLQPHFVIAVTGLDCDFIFAGEPPNSHKKQALGHSNGFDHYRKCSRALFEEHMPHNSGCFSDWTKFRAFGD
jgi:hypothetical protein